MPEQTCKLMDGHNGVKMCAVHKVPLQQQTMTELAIGVSPADFTAWICPVSGKTIMIPSF
jgi:hypothetical protein